MRSKKEIECLADKGYQGIQKTHACSQTPKKRKVCGEGLLPQNFLRQKPREGKLSYSDKKANKELAKKRVLIENVFAHLKKFRILAGKYRNRRKRFGLRFNLIASIYNYELHLCSNQILI